MHHRSIDGLLKPPPPTPTDPNQLNLGLYCT
jgi:hypothetical protein